MSNNKNRTTAGDNGSVAPDAAHEENNERVHIGSGGVPRKILETYYDPKQNCVIDVIEVKRVVQNRRGQDVEITLKRNVYSKDEALQAKYRRNPDGPVAIRSEVRIDG